MKSNLGRGLGLGIVPALLAGCALWIGCGGTSTTSAPTDSGTAPETSAPEAGTTPDGGGGTDASTDATVIPPNNGPFIDLQYGMCPTFAACGGDPKGLWNVTGGCVSEKIFDAAKQQCPNLAVSNVKFQARGNVNATATNIARQLEVKFTAAFAVPPECKNGNPVGTTCKDAETALKFAGLATAACKDNAAMGCDCDVTNDLGENTSDPYTVSGNTLTANARTFDFCVTGNEIKYTETTAKAPIPAVFTLTK